MSSSSDRRLTARVVREPEVRALSPALLVSSRDALALHLPTGSAFEGPNLADRLAEERAAGYAEGRAAALEEELVLQSRRRNAELAELGHRLSAAADAVAAERRRVVEEVAGEAAALAVAVTETLLSSALDKLELPAAAAVARALALAPEGQDLVVRLHPDAVLDPDHLASLTPPGEVKVVADPTVEPTGCVVEAGACRIDAQIGPALERVRKLLGSMR